MIALTMIALTMITPSSPHIHTQRHKSVYVNV